MQTSGANGVKWKAVAAAAVHSLWIRPSVVSEGPTITFSWSGTHVERVARWSETFYSGKTWNGNPFEHRVHLLARKRHNLVDLFRQLQSQCHCGLAGPNGGAVRHDNIPAAATQCSHALQPVFQVSCSFQQLYITARRLQTTLFFLLTLKAHESS